MTLKNLLDHKNEFRLCVAQTAPRLYIQVWGDGEGNSTDHPERLIGDVLSSQKAVHREFLKGWKQHKLCKTLPEREQIQKMQLQKNNWLWQSLESGYTVAYHNIDQTLLLLPIEILRVLLDLQNLMTLGAKYNGLPHQRALPSKSRILCQRLYSETNILLQMLKLLLTKQWLSLLQKDGVEFSGYKRFGSLASWLKLHLFLLVYPPLKIYSNKTCLDRIYLAKTRLEKTHLERILPRKAYFRKFRGTCFHGSISEKFIILKEAPQSTNNRRTI